MQRSGQEIMTVQVCRATPALRPAAPAQGIGTVGRAPSAAWALAATCKAWSGPQAPGREALSTLGQGTDGLMVALPLQTFETTICFPMVRATTFPHPCVLRFGFLC